MSLLHHRYHSSDWTTKISRLTTTTGYPPTTGSADSNSIFAGTMLADDFVVISLWSHWLEINISPVVSATEALCWCGFEVILKPFIVLLAPPLTAHTHGHTYSAHTPFTLWTPVLSDSWLCVTWSVGLTVGWMRSGSKLMSLSLNFYKSSQLYWYSPISQITISLKGFCNLYSLQHPLSLDPQLKWGQTPTIPRVKKMIAT